MPCNFIAVGANKNCTENFSGVGSTVYVFTKDDVEKKNLKPAFANDGTNRWKEDAFSGLPVVPIKVKAHTGQVTATSMADGGGFSNVYTGRIANDMDNMSAVARIMNNRPDWGILVPTGKLNDEGKKEYIVLYDEEYDIEFSMESTTGDAVDSDHGHTVTITQAPMLYSLPKWYGDIEIKETKQTDAIVSDGMGEDEEDYA